MRHVAACAIICPAENNYQILQNTPECVYRKCNEEFRMENVKAFGFTLTERIDSEGNFTFVCQLLRLLPNDLRPLTKYVLGAGALLLYELMRQQHTDINNYFIAHIQKVIPKSTTDRDIVDLI